MTLFPFTAKLLRNKMFGTLGGLALAGAAMLAAAPGAAAQQIGFGVEIGGPRYVPVPPPPAYREYAPAYGYGYAAPAYGYDRYAAHEYWEQRRRQEWREHEYWEHRRFEEGYGRPAPYRSYPY